MELNNNENTIDQFTREAVKAVHAGRFRLYIPYNCNSSFY